MLLVQLLSLVTQVCYNKTNASSLLCEQFYFFIKFYFLKFRNFLNNHRVEEVFHTSLNLSHFRFHTASFPLNFWKKKKKNHISIALYLSYQNLGSILFQLDYDLKIP